MSQKTSPGAAALEGFVVLANASQGQACIMVIQQVLKHPQIFVFGELLELKNIKDMEGDAECAKYLNLLQLFAYGTYQDYKNQSGLPPLNPAETRKLKQLTLVSMASTHKTLQYEVLLKSLELGSVRELEDLIIDSIYMGLIAGQLDQNKAAFEVKFAIGRDLGPDDVDNMMNTLEQWVQAAEATQKHLESRIQIAQQRHEEKMKEEADLTSQQEDAMTAIQLMKKEGGDGEMGMLGNMMGMIGAGPRKGGGARSKGSRMFRR